MASQGAEYDTFAIQNYAKVQLSLYALGQLNPMKIPNTKPAPTLGYKTVGDVCFLCHSPSSLPQTSHSIFGDVLGTSQMLACTAGCLTQHCPPTWCVSRLHSHHTLLCSMNHNTLCLHCAPLSHLRDSKGSKEWQWRHGNRNENGKETWWK
jgi:hypothetical protein